LNRVDLVALHPLGRERVCVSGVKHPVVAAVTDRTRHPPPSGLVRLTCNEVQHLFATLLARPPLVT